MGFSSDGFFLLADMELEHAGFRVFDMGLVVLWTCGPILVVLSFACVGSSWIFGLKTVSPALQADSAVDHHFQWTTREVVLL